MTIFIVARKYEKLSGFGKEREGYVELMPDERVGFVDVGIGPMKIPSNEIEIFVEDRVVTGRAHIIVEIPGKARPRCRDAVKFANVRRN